MENSEILFEIVSRLELMHTLIGVIINMVDEREISTITDAMSFANKKDTIVDMLHITLNEIVDIQEISKEQERQDAAAQNRSVA